MRISELSDASGVPIATLKFYLREGVLERGHVTSATRADYGPEHLERVGLVSALTNVRGLPIAKVREILAIIDGPQLDPVEAMGHAVAALPPYDDEAPAGAGPRAGADVGPGGGADATAGGDAGPGSDADAGAAIGASAFPRAERAAHDLGFDFDPGYPATRQLEAALEGLEHAGLEWNTAVAHRYGDALVPLAERELAPLEGMTARQGVAYAVLGTALYEPVILALRRLAHRHLVERTGRGSADGQEGDSDADR
ncbi:MerR family transcriptional regulator [Herbiconiux sp. P15]|uniref:MerR family transcriptional regulator n=1 Tax=Herbiconiux liukaitaii TaxID=3342799 RepID=UPI0035B830FB